MSYGIKFWTDLSSIMSQCTRLVDKQTDGRTNRILIARPRLHSMQRGKNSHQERSSRRSTASSAECFLVGVGALADGELFRRLLQRLSGGVDSQVLRRPR